MAMDFDWNGVQIDSERQLITINGSQYSFDQINGTSVTVTKNCFGSSTGGEIIFRVKDLKKPLHKVKVRSVFGKIDENYERIGIILDLKRF